MSHVSIKLNLIELKKILHLCKLFLDIAFVQRYNRGVDNKGNAK
nr:MAG TPA: hypothetical protein [Microviridae sp.]